MVGLQPLTATPSLHPRAALLIDADNFHHPEQLLAVFSQFRQHAGKGVICHVHGDGKRLQNDALKSVWIEMAARLFPCLPLRKNTTDVALAADALVLHFRHGVTRFAVASGDADFAPLSMQLRELGCEVTCYARMAIAFDGMVSYYDRVVRFDELPPSLAGNSASGPAQTVKLSLPPAVMATERVLSVPVVAPSSLVVSSAKPNPEPAKKTTPSNPKPVAPTARAEHPEAPAVRQILAVLPKWLPCTVKQLNQLGGPLREKGLKTGNAPLHQLFRKYPDFFTVLPKTGQPRTVRLERQP